MTEIAILKEKIRKLDVLPAMRETARKILALPLHTELGEKSLLELIARDPQLTAKIIGLANSPALGATRRVLSIQDAAKLLGLERVKAIAVSVAVITSLTRQPKGLLKVNELWAHSLTVAMAMKCFARAMPASCRPREEDIFLVGLLHDIGFLVLDQIDTERSDALLRSLAQDPLCDIATVEANLSLISHTELGAELVASWNFPQAIVEVMRHHHPRDGCADTDGYLLGLLLLAERLLPVFGHMEVMPEALEDQVWIDLGIDPERAAELCAAVHEYSRQAGELASILSAE